MQNRLGTLAIPETRDAAADIWATYSPRWQVFNTIRTIASGLALLCAAIGLTRITCPKG